MYKNKKILGIITARGGSKGIPKKNIKLLAGKPLVAYTIKAAAKSEYLTRTIVSTDNQEIADIAAEYDADVPFMRPAEYATDNATSLDVVKHAVSTLEKKGENYDYVMILQPTSPLRTPRDIDSCIEKIVDTNADSVMSMMELQDFSIKKLKKIKDDQIFPFLEEEGAQSSMRQDLPKVFKRNCAIYLSKVSNVKNNDLFGNVSRPYMMPYERSIDINEQIDFDLAEFFIIKNGL